MSRPLRRTLSLLTMLVLSGCVPVFSEMQSARITDPGRVEFTPTYSVVSYVDENEKERVVEHFGLQYARGSTDGRETRLRYDLIRGLADEDEPVIHRFQIGPKMTVHRDVVAVSVPFTLLFIGGLNPLRTLAIHPTLLTTIPVCRGLEINPSAKVMVPLVAPNATAIALNLGLGVGNDLREWAWRPEVGIQFVPEMDEGYFIHVGMGFTFRQGS